MSEPSSLLTLVARELSKHTFPMTDSQCVDLCNAVAWEARAEGWGLSRKVSGARGQRYDGQECAHDILHHRPTNLLFDVLVDAPEHPKAAWQNKGGPQSADRTWVAPIPPKGEAVPVPPQPPATAGPTNAEIMAVLRDIQVALDLIGHNAREGALTALKTQNDLERGLSVTLNGNLFSKASGLARAQRG